MPQRHKNNRQSHKQTLGSFRVISGQWRSRRLNFPIVDGLRPTTDRIRETLFSWLHDNIRGAKVIDLFAGSGSLGIEALSRGAAETSFIELNRIAVQGLKDNLELLNSQASLVNIDAMLWLESADLSHVDVIFLDPPFRKGYLDRCINILNSNDTLKNGAVIYMELEKERVDLNSPINWTLLKQKIVGQVSFRLYEINND